MTTPGTKKLGLFACTTVVAGNMMGSGIALLPANLAGIGRAGAAVRAPRLSGDAALDGQRVARGAG